jgi:uncharacterized protein with HEPN domain
MSKRKLDVYLQDIILSIQQIEKYLMKSLKTNFIRIPKSRMLFFGDWRLLERQ